MKILFCTNMFINIETDIKKMKTPPPVSSHKYQENILQGLIENKQNISVLNIPRVRYYPNYPQIIFKRNYFVWKNKKIGKNINFINLIGLNYLTQTISLTKILSKEIKKNINEKYILISFNTYLPQSLAMINIQKRYKNVILCNIIGDLHGKYGVYISDRYKGIKGKIIKNIEKIQDQLAKQYDVFGFLTEHMAEILEANDKPYVVIEGIYHETSPKIIQETNSENLKIIFYAGAIEEEYGLNHLLNAFSLIDEPNYRLEIAGGGSFVKKLQEQAKKDKRIIYLGYIPPKEVQEHQQRATVLINPRKSTYEYVKYSFPSKNMECLASGKPYIAHRLPCYPPEYDKYIQYTKDETDKELSNKIIEICNLPNENRIKMGKEAREFILREKNPKKQCEKLVKMFLSL